MREGIERIININMYRNDLDYISNKIKESISIELKKFYKSQRKMQAKLLRTEVINTYMNNEICEKIDNVLENKEEIEKLYSIWRKKYSDNSKKLIEKFVKLGGGR